MKDLAVRLAALDADASAAVRVIAYFDGLVEAGAGLQSIVRGAAVLAGCPARLDDPARRVHIRVLPDGVASPSLSPPSTLAGPSLSASGLAEPSPALSGVAEPSPALSGDERWPSVRAGSATLSLERPGPPGPVDQMVLERAAGAARTVLDRTRGRASATDEIALIELLIDADAPPDARQRAARHLALPADAPAHVVVLLSGRVRVTAAVAAPHPPHQGPTRPEAGSSRSQSSRLQSSRLQSSRAESSRAEPPGNDRAGIGPAVPILDLPASYRAARTALRFTAAGTDDDPGDPVIRYEDLGALAALATIPDPGAVPDVRVLEHAAATAPWLLSTLHAVSTTISLRAAAARLRLHHSTLQDRVAHAEHLLGWSVREPHGLLRTQLALALSRLHRTPLDGATHPA
ncbi:helix-turn-helix domain-containing protein [Actinoplanes sp. NPDC023714]|uniref:helix-turn-helix domain-containing protein n=1 Tax=Actinoplanes sp. NPDC023714 TaxID=3154322 RepID=UPI0033F61685